VVSCAFAGFGLLPLGPVVLLAVFAIVVARVPQSPYLDAGLSGWRQISAMIVACLCLVTGRRRRGANQHHHALGPLNGLSLPEREATACFPGRQVEELSLEVPQRRKPERLPPDVRIETPHFSYTSQWSLDGRIVRVHREMVSRVDVPVCGGDLRHRTADALAAIRRGQRAKIILAAP
jgi:hypothetical protein